MPELRRREVLIGGACAWALTQSSGAAFGQFVSAPSRGAPSSSWIKGFNSSVRLIGGALPPSEIGGKSRLIVGVEMRLEEGWKTYWRHPGDDGGLPPSFDWSASKNLRSAKVLYPVPKRLKGLTGISIGYVNSVLFPVEIEAENASSSVELALSIEYGICREICVPAEMQLKLSLPARLAVMPPEIAAALEKVPQRVVTTKDILRAAKAVLTGPAPMITLDIAADGGGTGEGSDLFAEVVEGSFLPVAYRRGGASGGAQRYVIDLKGVDEAPALAGKTLRLTLASSLKPIEILWSIK